MIHKLVWRRNMTIPRFNLIPTFSCVALRLSGHFIQCLCHILRRRADTRASGFGSDQIHPTTSRSTRRPAFNSTRLRIFNRLLAWEQCTVRYFGFSRRRHRPDFFLNRFPGISFFIQRYTKCSAFHRLLINRYFTPQSIPRNIITSRTNPFPPLDFGRSFLSK